MKEKMVKQIQPTKSGDWLILTGSLITGGFLLLIFPGHEHKTLLAAKTILVELTWILPGILIFIGLFTVWVSKELVVKNLGKTSGIKGILMALVFGALPTGPLYVAFPLAAALRKKGASVSNVVIFLSAWACIKIPQEMVELQFMGLSFMTARLVLTILFIIITGWMVERVIPEFPNAIWKPL
ncbi:hypothetical protein B1H10_09080 [candidate division KSB1 bacterium 4484_188]|nr:MAG: hypothetical protein B1H10_09080 [candidate division KSB1 bacterium 4484_188]